ncbi:MAG: hypothetical protein RL701_4214 [Pseudomonadota bacterium]|jgi:acetate kinase
MTESRILSLNAGSSSLKFSLWQMGSAEERELWTGAAEGLGGADARLWLRREGQSTKSLDHKVVMRDVPAAIAALFELCKEQQLATPQAVGHRIVHGGPHHSAPCLIDAALVAELRGLIPWAPLHLPAALAALEATTQHYPTLPQVACFDTAFHRKLPEVAQRFPLPRALWEQGVRRYGFHGLSYEYIVAFLGNELGERTVVAHLGNGASLTALRAGQPVDTSMGFTPLGGVMMGTRSGDLDPGVLVYLLTTCGYDTRSLARMLERESGLLGVSGETSDLKQLLDRREHNPHAAQALESFCYSVRKQIGAYAAVLGGLDMLVFTGGIGERASWVREQVCQPLGYLGIALDLEANTHAASHSERISRSESTCQVRVVATDEARMIARHTRDLTA